MGLQVEFAQWGTQSLDAGGEAWWWYSWIFDGDHWSRMSALPVADSPPGGSIQIMGEWATEDTLHVHWRNNGTDKVVFMPTAIVVSTLYVDLGG